MPDVVPTVLARRAVLLAGGGALLAACGSSTSAPPSGALATGTTAPASKTVDPFLAVEQQLNGRLGVVAFDTGSGKTVSHRPTERFLLCSTHKVVTVATLLRKAQDQEGLLDKTIRYSSKDLLDYAPVTKQHVATGMTLRDLCDAALTVSDNTAANLVMTEVGGPQAVTAFLRSIGDLVTRVDRTEPDLNKPDGDKDTTTPAAIAATLQVLALGANALDVTSRNLLNDWMTRCTTGTKLIRAGVPAGWAVADKTGSGFAGEINDIAVVRPPARKPLLICVYTAPTDPKSTGGTPAVAAAAKIVAAQLKS